MESLIITLYLNKITNAKRLVEGFLVCSTVLNKTVAVLLLKI